MRFSAFLLFSVFGYMLPFVSVSQTAALKPVIDSAAYRTWTSLSNRYAITGDGKYAAYEVKNQPVKGTTVVFASTQGGWHKEIPNAEFIGFTSDNQKGIFKAADRTLGIFELEDSSISSSSEIKDISIPQTGFTRWVVGSGTRSPNSLLIIDVISGTRDSVPYVTSAEFTKSGNKLLLVSKSTKKDEQELFTYDLNTKQRTMIWQGIGLVTKYMNGDGSKVLFVTKRSESDPAVLQYFDRSMDEPACLFTDGVTTSGRKFQFLLDSDCKFNSAEDKFFFKLQCFVYPSSRVKQEKKIDINIWSYKDELLQPEQDERDVINAYWVANLHSGRTTEMIRSDEMVQNGLSIIDLNSDTGGDYFIIVKPNKNRNYYSPKRGLGSFYIVSAADGKSNFICDLPNQVNAGNNLFFKAGKKYAVWFDNQSLSWNSFEYSTGQIHNLTASVSTPFHDEEALKSGRRVQFNIAGWSDEGNSVFIYDQFDIWRFDLTGRVKPVNFTQGVGRKLHFSFSFLNDNLNRYFVPNEKDPLLLSAFDIGNKQSGYWMLQNQSLKKCTMGDYAYFIQRVGRKGFVDFRSAGLPIKAKNADVYLVPRMSATESLNLFVSSDFNTYRQLSFIRPEKNYNWLTAELITWNMTDGEKSQGVLYKPENFDPKKKYPIIFHYYDKRSDLLNSFRIPNFSTAELDIPTYVSNGYLVFIPDIYYLPGKSGDGVVNSVVSGAEFLSQKAWVDKARMGIQGHSFGGWETNYLITHTKLFAAACESAGQSDQVSGYGQLEGVTGYDRQSLYEVVSQGGPYGTGVAPWTRPDLYINNSPVFKIGDITTPLLMRHSEEDLSVPFPQAIEFYLGMRRAGKKVWLLQHHQGGHIVSGKDAVDYTIRMRQFFDHYLKGAMPPVWMTTPIPASKQGIELGYQLDSAGKCGSDCPVCSGIHH